MASKRILIIGGNGYIGRKLVKNLSKKYRITLLLRGANKISNCDFFIGDLLDKKSLEENIKHQEFDIVINLAGVIKSIKKSKYKDNFRSMKNLIEVLEKREIRNIIYFSTQNVNLKNHGFYTRSKKMAEDFLIKSSLNYIIIRPNYVYGIDNKNYFYTTCKLISNFNSVPILGDGKNFIQPVLVNDLIKIITDVVNKKKKYGCEIIEVSGNMTVSINSIIDMVGEYMGEKPTKIHIPLLLVKLLKRLVYFDVDGFNESRISKKPYKHKEGLSLKDNIKKIVELYEKG